MVDAQQGLNLVCSRMRVGKSGISGLPHTRPEARGHLKLPGNIFQIVDGVIGEIFFYQGVSGDPAQYDTTPLVQRLPSREYLQAFGHDNKISVGTRAVSVLPFQTQAGNITRVQEYSYSDKHDGKDRLFLKRIEHGGLISMKLIEQRLGGASALLGTPIDAELSNEGTLSDPTKSVYYEQLMNSAPAFIATTKAKIKDARASGVPVTTSFMVGVPDFFLPDHEHELLGEKVTVNTEAYTAVLILSTNKAELELDGEHRIAYHRFDWLKPSPELLGVQAYQMLGKTMPFLIDTTTQTPYARLLDKHDAVIDGAKAALGLDGYAGLVGELRLGTFGPYSRGVADYCDRKMQEAFEALSPLLEGAGVPPVDPACGKKYFTSLHLPGDFIKSAMDFSLDK